jgi:hypothetical protein
MTYHKQFEISQQCAPGPCGELCSWIPGWIKHVGCHSDRFFMRTNRSFHDTYDITHLNFVSTLCQKYWFCIVNKQCIAKRNRTFWQSYSAIRILSHSYGALDPCTCTDELSCRTNWSVKSRKSWHVAKLIYNLLFTTIRRQTLQFACLFSRRHSSRHHLFIGIRYLYRN